MLIQVEVDEACQGLRQHDVELHVVVVVEVPRRRPRSTGGRAERRRHQLVGGLEPRTALGGAHRTTDVWTFKHSGTALLVQLSVL